MLALSDDASPIASPEPASLRIAISAAAGSAAIVKLDSTGAATKLRSILTSAATPKSIHDYKAAIHSLDALGINLQGVQHDPMLYSYLLDPTYSSHRLSDVALRRFNLKLSRLQPITISPKPPTSPAGSLPYFAKKSTGRTDQTLRRDRSPARSRARPHGAGRSKNRHRRARADVNRTRNARSLSKPKISTSWPEANFNIGSPKQLGDVLFNKLNLPKPGENTAKAALYRPPSMFSKLSPKIIPSPEKFSLPVSSPS